MAKQPIFPVVKVHTGYFLDSPQPVIETAAVEGQRRGGPLDVARVIQVRLERPYQRLITGEQTAQPVW